MPSFSERHGYKPDRSRLHQIEEMDYSLRIAIWNFLREHYFDYAYSRSAYARIKSVWTEVLRERFDDLSTIDNKAAKQVWWWYFEASWYEVYDVLEYLLGKKSSNNNSTELNAMLQREGSAYRFIGGVIAPITNNEELAEIDTVLQHTAPFDVASQHIRQAVTLLSDREHPDARNAIKEAISAVESAVGIASGDQKAGVAKALQKLGLHPQLERAWNNMYNWTSDEDGVRHAMKEMPQVGLAEARYMVVACSAFVNYLIARDTEGSNQ